MALALIASGCGGTVDDATIEVKLSGMRATNTVVLQNNGADDLTLKQNGDYSFAKKLGPSTSYNVTVAKQPLGQNCSVARGNGTIVYTADGALPVLVSCQDSASLVGTLTGLKDGLKLVVSDGQANFTLIANGDFAVSDVKPVGSPYALSVATQPMGQTCTVTNGTGTIPASGVTAISINCI